MLIWGSCRRISEESYAYQAAGAKEVGLEFHSLEDVSHGLLVCAGGMQQVCTFGQVRSG